MMSLGKFWFTKWSSVHAVLILGQAVVVMTGLHHGNANWPLAAIGFVLMHLSVVVGCRMAYHFHTMKHINSLPSDLTLKRILCVMELEKVDVRMIDRDTVQVGNLQMMSSGKAAALGQLLSAVANKERQDDGGWPVEVWVFHPEMPKRYWRIHPAGLEEDFNFDHATKAQLHHALNTIYQETLDGNVTAVSTL